MKKLIFFLITSLSLYANAGCFLESPFPFPLNLTTVQALNKHWVASADGSYNLYVSTEGKDFPHKIAYTLFSNKNNATYSGFATLHDQTFCDSRSSLDLCFYFYAEGVHVEINTRKTCGNLEFPL